MEEIEVLKELFDQKILNIINAFLENTEKNLSLSQISSISKVNITTTFRIVNKLVSQDFLSIIPVGKSKFYKLKRSPKTKALLKVISVKQDEISEFIDKLEKESKIKKVILESKKSNEAKLIIVGDFINNQRINSICQDIKSKYNFDISFVNISEKQYTEMEKLGLYNLSEKIIWENKT